MRITVWRYFAGCDYLVMCTYMQGSLFTSLYVNEFKSVTRPDSNWVHSSFFIRIYFKTISNPKFTKFQEYFKNKANAHILKRNNYLCWKFLNTVEPCPALGAPRYCGHLIFFRRNAWPFSNLDSFHTTPEKFESKRSFIPTVS